MMKWCAFLLSFILLSFGGMAWWNEHRFLPLTKLIQQPVGKGVLRSSHLAEILDLSRDLPTSKFDCKKGEAKLLATPWIAAATLKRVAPDTLWVTYRLREPVARIGDYQNMAMDREGVQFPLYPYFSPKQLPEVYLGAGLEKKKYLHLAFAVLESFKLLPKQENFRVKRIDVSHAFTESLGDREIVLLVEDTLYAQESVYRFPKILRLPIKDYAQQLNNFFSLRQSMLQEYGRQIRPGSPSESEQQFVPRTVDLRISKLAFIENEG